MCKYLVCGQADQLCHAAPGVFHDRQTRENPRSRKDDLCDAGNMFAQPSIALLMNQRRLRVFAHADSRHLAQAAFDWAIVIRVLFDAVHNNDPRRPRGDSIQVDRQPLVCPS